jgi:integrase
MVGIVVIAGREGRAVTMPVRRDSKTDAWFFRTTVKTPEGTKLRLYGTPGALGPYQDLAATKVGAQEAEQRAIRAVFAAAAKPALVPEAPEAKEEVPTFEEWFNGRFWTEWVIARRNKPSEVEAKLSIFKVHLKHAFGGMRLDKIDVATIARFRAKLIEAGKSDKRINNILAVLSKALTYAEQARVISSTPYIGFLQVERPDIVAWSLEEYARLLAAAKALDPTWYAACCLAGEAGLRVGEIRALDWKRDVDLIAGTITVNKQTRRAQTTSPKGRTRRTVPMTETLLLALKALETVRTGFVIRGFEGSAMSDNETKYHCYRLCRAAGLPERGWHNLRHAFGTHAAVFGVNPWKLMQWMGHKRIDETMLYVHFAEAHLRPLPEPILHAQRGHDDPDRKVIAMLSARGICVPRGSGVAVNDPRSEESSLISVS